MKKISGIVITIIILLIIQLIISYLLFNINDYNSLNYYLLNSTSEIMINIIGTLIGTYLILKIGKIVFNTQILNNQISPEDINLKENNVLSRSNSVITLTI